jgi:ABC-type phosphate transport system permease subunit
MEAGALSTSVRGGRSIIERSPRSRALDPLLRWVLTGLAGLILVLIAFFFIRLFVEAKPAFDKYGYAGFVFDNSWVPSQQLYGALPLVVGTLITSAIAVVYGLWGIQVLAPKLEPAEQWFSDTFGFLPLVGGQVSIPNYFVAGLILAIMIVPIVSAISREVMSTVPADHKEAALALGATRWEMIRMSVLPYSRAGISGAAMLGLGRAIGETIAVTIVIGNAPDIGKTVFSQGYTLAAVIANEFGEAASDPTHRAALIAAGLVLFVLTLIVNAIARFYVNRASRPATVPKGMAG